MVFIAKIWNMFIDEIWNKKKKGRVAARRVWTGMERIGIILVFLFFSAMFSYLLIAYAVSYMEDKYFPPVSEFKKAFSWYVTQPNDRTGYIPAITVASASLMLSLITLLQSHFSRVQDRVMGFPPNYLDEVMIGLNVRENLDLARKFFDPLKSKNLIKLSYKSGFSTYYKFYPYRLFVSLSKESMGKGIEWEEIKLYHFQYSNIRDDDPNSYEVLIEGSESRLLKEYCDKPDKNEDIKLKLILDSRWTNRLIPLWMRNFSDMYIREVFGLSFEKCADETQTEKTASFSTYKVLFSEYKTAPLASWCLLHKCAKTEKAFSSARDREAENAKQLQKRGNKHGR